LKNFFDKNFESVGDMQRSIALSNTAQVIHNTALYGPVDNSTLVIVIQVHTRLHYLAHLIASLAKARHIDEALLIFSHDFYDADLNRLISSISFCRYAQVFYPFSTQTHPNKFPGDDPRDCPRDLSRAEAEKSGCLNAKWPDKFGHYREAKFTIMKHHWWWKACYLFEGGFRHLNAFTGDIMFLEEDHVVVEDFIHVYRLFKNSRETWCQGCAMIMSLGNYRMLQDPEDTVAEVTQWASSQHNMGMVFGRGTWNVIKRCAAEFCSFDDYNWDWSLMFVGMTCMRPALLAFMLKTSRVFHIGVCGFHHKGRDCDVRPILERVREQVEAYHGQLYPRFVTDEWAMDTVVDVPPGNGGWGDIRDRELCMNFTKPDFLAMT
jgi:alpha-1,6-mannosyl-glycoprotein beta-1,2-N-acetylglucosaminyltransferase